MKLRWIALAAVYIPITIAQKCNVTYFDENGYFPLVVEEIPLERCPRDNNCCWCSYGNATSTTAWCCISIACNAIGVEPFERFARSVCTANMGITSPGNARSCPALGSRLKSLNLMTSITDETASNTVAAVTPTTAGGGVPTNFVQDSERSNNPSRPKMAGRRKMAIAISVSLVGSTIIILAAILLWRRRKAAKRKMDDLHSKISELPTEANTHEIEGRAMERTPLNSKPQEIMSRNVGQRATQESSSSGRREVRVVPSERPRNEGTPLSSTALLPNWSPVSPDVDHQRISTALSDKPLPPPPKLKSPVVPPKNGTGGRLDHSKASRSAGKI